MKDAVKYGLGAKKWLLNSNIRLKAGGNWCGFYGWKNMLADNESSKYPFLYNDYRIFL